MNEQFWLPYKDQSVQVVAIDANVPNDTMGGVQAYVEHLVIDFPVGIEQTTTNYDSYKTNFSGQNPFPIDIIVDKQGIIRYIAREYDAPTMLQIVDELIAE